MQTIDTEFVLIVFFGGVEGGDIERKWLLLLIILYDREVLRKQIQYHKVVIKYY